jgi:hypothetical protein
MINRLAMKIGITFFILYGLFSLFGTVFFVGWGGENVLKSAVLFFYKFPIDWIILIVEKSFWFLLLNILFWSIVVYIFVIFVIRVKLLFR